MASLGEKLAESLEVLKKLQDKGNKVAIKSSEITRTHKERLLKAGFLKEVTKGWYMVANPTEQIGDTTSWYTSYWQFCARYLKAKYGKKYCLSPEQSLLLHAGNTVVPHQMIIKSPKAPNDTIQLMHGTSLYVLKSPISKDLETEEYNGIRIMTKESALIYSSPIIFTKSQIEVRTVLALIVEASELLQLLLEGGHTVIAGRLAGAFRNIGKFRIADDIVKTMKTAGFNVRENDPFEDPSKNVLEARETSPYVNRIKLLWAEMRKTVIDNFPQSPGLPQNIKKYLMSIDEIYVTDAYHSLSIERYVVSINLIEKVRSGAWNLENDEDRRNKDVMAARGYWQATQAVKKSIEKILNEENSGNVFDDDHRDWYRELFAPSVTAGMLKPADLAGYRTHQVYISNSMHTPLNKTALREAMPAFIDLLIKESEASVRVVLGHFFFAHIHPYMDGNGRMARFLMNAMLASGGYQWTVIPVEKRNEYMSALEKASINSDIKPFTLFLANLVKSSLEGKPVATLKR